MNGTHTTIRVSHPEYGLGFGLPEDAVNYLGGINAPVALSKCEKKADGTRLIRLAKDPKSHSRIHANGQMQLPLKSIQHLGLPGFGPISADWTPNGNGIDLQLPPLDRLPAPIRKRRQSESFVRVDVTPHDRLRAAIRTINELCAGADVADVTFSLQVPDGRDGQEHMTTATIRSKDFRITAKRVIEETLS